MPVLWTFYTVMGLFAPFVEAADQDLASLTSHVLQLEQTVSDLQSRAQIQEQKQAAVLSSVLSELSTLKTDYSTLQTELTTIKDRLKDNEEELSMVKNDLGECHDNLTSSMKFDLHNSIRKVENITDELVLVKSNEKVSLNNLNSIKTGFQTFTSEMKVLTTEIQGNLTLAEKEVKHLKANQNVSDTGLQSVKSQVTSFITKQNSMKSEQQNLMSQISKAQTDVNHLKTDMSQVNTSSAHNLATLKSLQARQHQKTPDIYFRLHHGGNNMHVQADKLLKFDILAANIRGPGDIGYDAHTGIYTIPEAGVYIFWITGFLAGTNQYSLVHIDSNYGVLGRAFGFSGDASNGLLSGFTIAHLNKGNTVHFQNIHNATFGARSNVGGALLHN